MPGRIPIALIAASLASTLSVAGQEATAMVLTSPAFEPRGSIPSRHTCDGTDVSPALSWTGLPKGTKSVALVVADPDAPDPKAPKMTWAHWVLYDLPPEAAGLAEAVAQDKLPAGTRQGVNDWGKTGYRGPCPPVGRHRYVHTLYALDVVLPDLGNPTRAELVGTYQHP
jgi:Raf kinase inhibitor-like YbhB/YbcL family protein